MSTSKKQDGIVQDLGVAIDELHSALQRAAGATATIKGLLPRVTAITSVFDELEAVIETGRQQFGADAAARQAPASFPRPTIVAPSGTSDFAPSETSEFTPIETPAIEQDPAPFEFAKTGESAPPPSTGEELTSFRLEFESRPGPLDLRAVDDAVSEHPAVRDVALLDYDGRKATLKVWIVATASPADVQETLTNKAANLFPGGNDVTIVALEDVA